MQKQMWVYILASKSRRLYVGVTGDMLRRWAQHQKASGTFVAKYRIHRLVHVESVPSPLEAITREKQLKGWRRDKKIELIERKNPTWEDLAERWGWRDG